MLADSGCRRSVYRLAAVECLSASSVSPKTRAPGLLRSLPLRTAPLSVAKVFIAFGFVELAVVECLDAYGSLRCNRVSAPQVAPTPDCFSLRKPNAKHKCLRQRPRSTVTHSRPQSVCLRFHSLRSPVLSLRSGSSADDAGHTTHAHPVFSTLLPRRRTYRPMSQFTK